MTSSGSDLPLFILIRGDKLNRDYKSELIKLVGNKLEEVNMWIDDVIYDKKHKNLEVVIDSKDVITIDDIVVATKVINPIIDENNFIDEKYILDVYGKSKGE